MSKIVLDEVTSTTQVSKINENFTKLETALNDKVLYRDNPSGEPNTLVTDVDVNGMKLYNLPAPILQSQAARLQDVTDAITGAKSAALTSFSPYGSVSATNVQGAIQELDTEKVSLAQLAASSGSSLVGFIQSGTGTVARTSQDKERDILSVKDFSGTDQEKFAASCLVGSSIIPAGSYNLTSQVDGVFWSANSEQVTEPNNNADIRFIDKLETVNKSASRARQLIYTNLYLQNNFLQGVVNIGDSISHGAYSGNAYTNHWTYLLARSINAEFGGKSIGEYPMEGLYNPIAALATPQLADVVFVGWGSVSANPAPYDYPTGNIGVSAANSVNGKTYSSSINGATIALTLPTMGRVITFKYTQQPGGGAFSISINGVVKLNVNTTGALTYNVNTISVNLEDNGKGECVILITKTDASPVEINSLYNLKTDAQGITDLGSRMQLHNYAQSGRALQDMSESAIIRVCNSACLIVSLGYNDWSLGSDTDDGVFAAFKQRIDWLIQYSKVYKNLVVVQDFIWYGSKHSRTRRQLKRLADAVNGIYLPYPDQFFSNSGQPVQSPPQLNSPLYLWADAAHPNALGNELIFSTLSTALGLSVNNRNLALKYNDWAFPLKIASANLVNNSPLLIGSISTVQQIGDTFHFKINLKPPSGNFVQYAVETALSAFPVKFRNGQSITLLNQANVSSYDYATGLVKTSAIIESPLTLNIYTRGASESLCRCYFNLPEIV